MRVVVTGFGNPYGRAIVEELLERKYMVRLFGGTQDEAARFGGRAHWHPGDLKTPGSIEPVLAEREVLIHAACLDPPGKDKVMHARHIERGTLGCKYGAERELLDQFIHLTPEPSRRDRFREAQRRAVEIAESCRKVQTAIIQARGDPKATAKDVVGTMESGPHWGRYPGRESDAVAP